MKYDKLIRDKIPSLITDKIIKTKVITDKKEIEQYSLEKVYEELAELKEKPCIEEAADVIEVAYKYIQTVLGIDTIERLEFLTNEERKEKNNFKGAFSKNIILLEIEE